MSFQFPAYTAPDFTLPHFAGAPDAALAPAPMDKVAPEGYHATSIYPEYFKIDGAWILAEESRMDCVSVYRGGGRMDAVEFRNLKKGDLVVLGRTEDASQGIFVHADGFQQEDELAETFSFRQGRSRETAYSRDYDELYALLRQERAGGGNILWVMGPACSFDADSRSAFAALIRAGYVQGLMACAA